MASVIHCGDQCRRDDRPNAWEFGKAPARVVRTANCDDLRIESFDSPVQVAQLIEEIREYLSGEMCQLGFRDCGRRLRLKPPPALRKNDSVLCKQSS